MFWKAEVTLMAGSLAPLRNRFARRWLAPLVALLALASALALANDESWPDFESFTVQGWQGDWQLSTRQLQGLSEASLWCLDHDRDRYCEEWRYQDSSGVNDFCLDPDEDLVCNYRRKIYADASVVERFDGNANGFQEYRYIYDARGAQHRQWNANDNSHCHPEPGEIYFVQDGQPEPLPDRYFCLTREINHFFPPGENEFMQDYQASPLMVRWFDGDVFSDQIWDSNGDRKLDAYCIAQGTTCVTVTPDYALRLLDAMLARKNHWFQRQQAVAVTPGLNGTPLAIYVNMQYRRYDFVFNLIRTLAHQAY